MDKGEVAESSRCSPPETRSFTWVRPAARIRRPAGRLRTDDIFWIASMSKPITAVAIAILVDDGKVAFDDPVSKYLPDVLPEPAGAITLRDVLTHTGGLGELTSRGPHLDACADGSTDCRDAAALSTAHAHGATRLLDLTPSGPRSSK